MTAEIDYYYAPISGYAYLGERPLIQLAQELNCRVHFKPMDIARVFAASETVPPFKQSEKRLQYRLHDMQRIATRLGLPINPRPAHWPVPVALAAKTIYAAQALELDVHALSFAILSAVYAKQQNVSDPEVILDILTQLDFDAQAVVARREQEDIGAQLEQVTAEAIERGVFGSPTFIVNDEEIFFGQDRLADLAFYLKSL